MYPTISVLGITLSSYGLLAVIGFCAAACCALVLARKEGGGFPHEDIFYAFLCGVVGALVGAKLLFLLTLVPALVQHWAVFAAEPLATAGLMMSGFVFYGGLFGALAGGWLYCRRYGIDAGKAVALFVPGFPLFHLFGRIGCFLAGCCHGVPWAGGIAFHHALAAPNEIALFPVQLAEAGGNLLLFLLLLWLFLRGYRRALLPVYLAGYSVMRFGLEFLRGDALRGVWLLSASQWMALGVLAATAVWAARRRQRLAAE